MGLINDWWNGADYAERKRRNVLLDLVKNVIPTAYLLPRDDLLIVSISKKYTNPTNLELIIKREYIHDNDLEINKIDSHDIHKRRETPVPLNAEFSTSFGEFYIRKYKLSLIQKANGTIVFENSTLLDYKYSSDDFVNQLQRLVNAYRSTQIYSSIYHRYGFSPV